MGERIHKNKKFLSLFYDSAESLIDNFNDSELGEIMRAAIEYEFTGEKKQLSDRALQIQLNSICKEIDLSTAKADENSKKQSDRAKGRWSKQQKDVSEMTPEEMDADIEEMFNRGLPAHLR